MAVAFGKTVDKKLSVGKEGKIISMSQKFSFKLWISSGKFRVRISSKEQYIKAIDFKCERMSRIWLNDYNIPIKKKKIQ